MTALIQPSFAAGEVAPEVEGRVDIAKYQVAVKVAENFLVKAQGGLMNRPGFTFIAPTKYPDRKTRLIEFSYNTEQTYSLEFGDLYMRVIKDGGMVLEANKTITGASQAAQGVITSAAHGFTNGRTVFISGIQGMTDLNNRFFFVSDATTNDFKLKDQRGIYIDTSGFDAYVSGGTVAQVYEMATPYAASQLSLLKFTQSANVMTFTHPDHDPADLSRTNHDAWTLTPIDFQPDLVEPTNVSAAVSVGSGTVVYDYTVTAESDESGEISMAGFQATKAVTGATKANPAQITVVAHGYTTGSTVRLKNLGGMVELNDRLFTITSTGANTFTLNGVDSTGYTTYTSGGTAERQGSTVQNNLATVGNRNTISWSAVAGADRYNVYKKQNGIYGWIGQAVGLSFVDDNIAPDMTDTAPEPRNPFDGVGNDPRCVVYHQQRKIFGGTRNKPQITEASQTGRYNNMSVSKPSKADDSWTFAIVAKQVQEVRDMLSLTDLLVFTSGGVWKFAPGSSSDSITQSSIQVLQQTEYGISAEVPPLVIGNVALYVHDLGKTVSDIGYNFENDGYRGDDLTILSKHLLKFNTIKEWAWHYEPYRVAWAIRDDGVLLALTYVREHQVWAWTRQVTQGKFRSVCTIREDNENACYVVVERKLNGQTYQYIERLHTRLFRNADDCFFVDSGLELSRWNMNTASTVTLTGGTPISGDDPNWTIDDELTLTENGTLSPFTAGDVGREIVLRVLDEDGTFVTRNRFEVTSYTSSTVIGVTPLQAVPVELQNAATAGYGFATDEVTNLWHLEGKEVVALADGDVEGPFIVENGRVTLQTNAVQVNIGLSYNADMKTLRITGGVQNGNFVGFRKSIPYVDIMVEESRGIYAGPSFEERDLRPYTQRGSEEWGEPTFLETSIVRLNLPAEWNDGQFCIRQSDPLPLTILSIIPEVAVGG